MDILEWGVEEGIILPAISCYVITHYMNMPQFVPLLMDICVVFSFLAIIIKAAIYILVQFFCPHFFWVYIQEDSSWVLE